MRKIRKGRYVIGRAIREYRTADKQRRVLWMAVVSSVGNALVGVGKCLLGLLFSSPWYVINGVYYLLLCAARGNALRTYARLRGNDDAHAVYKRERAFYRRSGVFIAAIGMSYLLISVRMYFRGDVTRFPGYVVFVVVIVSLVKFCGGIYGFFHDRHARSPIIKAVRVFSLADAGVSLVMTRCALLLVVDAPGAVSNSALFGMIVSVGLMSCGGWIWCRSVKERGDGQLE